MDDIISLERVNKELGKRQILKDVTLAVKQGDIFGYLGRMEPVKPLPYVSFWG